MQIHTRELSADNVRDLEGCDDSFVVDSGLVLNAQAGVVSYTVEVVPPYCKRYPQDDVDHQKYMSSEGRAIFLAYVDGEPAGRIRLRENWNRLACIEDIAVDVRFRKQGVGRALMQQAIAWAQARRLTGIMLETQNNNVAACCFYRSCGFVLGGFDRLLYRGVRQCTDEVALYWYLLWGEGTSASH
jgi:streptothricin acetyltransferase